MKREEVKSHIPDITDEQLNWLMQENGADINRERTAMQAQLDTEKTARAAAEKERDDANTGKQAAEQALTDFKAQQSAKETHAAKTAKFKELLRAAGVYEKYIDRVVRLSGEDIDALELDEKGEVKDAKKHTDALKTEWGDYIPTKKTTGVVVETPPTNYAGTTQEQFTAMSLDERIKLKNNDPELYRQLRAK